MHLGSYQGEAHNKSILPNQKKSLRLHRENQMMLNWTIIQFVEKIFAVETTFDSLFVL